MALWMVRAGKYGQLEQKFLSENRLYLVWAGIQADLTTVVDRADVRELVSEALPDATAGKIANGTGQIWAFAHGMKPGDWFALPSKLKRVIHIGQIESELKHKDGDNFREVKWLQTDVPRTNFDQDLLYSLGAAMTVCRIKRNNAEERFKAMAAANWESAGLPKAAVPTQESDEEAEESAIIDLETVARDQIAQLIAAKFTGHGLAHLVNALLQAQGYTTYVSPAGPDKGVDILAAPGPLGFGEPRICVQVKSGASPLDRPTLDQLIGTMQNVQAKQGLLVSWGGFKSSVDKEEASQFFRVRLWDQDELINQVLEHYDKLDEDLRTELPLKRIWTVAEPEEDGG